MKKYLIIIALFISFPLFSQDISNHNLWKKAKELTKKGFYQQVVEIADSIYQVSLKNGDELNQVASILIKSKALSNYTDGSFEVVQEAIDHSDGAVKSMLNAYCSDLFLEYYRSHQWEIRNRLETTGPLPEDRAFWTHQNFSDKIESLIEESLKNTDALLLEKTIDWTDLFASSHGSHTVEPTLYEYILWQAIEFYQSREFSQQEIEDLMILNDTLLLGNYQDFSKIEFGPWENISFREKSLILYQRIIEKNKGNVLPRALLYQELKRLDYLKSIVAIENADEIVLKTMEQLFEEFKGQKGSEIIAERLIQRYTSNEASEEDYHKADRLCQIMIDHQILPEVFQTLKEQIHQKDLEIIISSTLIPHQAQLAQLSYKNLDKAYIRILRTNEYEELSMQGNEKFPFHKYTPLEAMISFDINISNQAQLAPLTALFEFPGLDYGSYIILASSGPDFMDGKDELAMGAFQVSYLDMVVMKSDHQFMVIDRLSGKAISGAKVEVLKQEWEYSSRQFFSTQIGVSKTNEKGILQIDYKESNIKVQFKISKGNDAWTSPTTYMNRKSTGSQAREKCVFFTDRSIYRPGQKVYFKGIITLEDGNDVQMIPYMDKEVKLYGTHGKLLQTIKVSSNAFGSISGSFDLPFEGLTGNMRITDGKGSTHFKVEEYKRPKFKISLESPGEEYQINDLVTIKGKTDYYSGSDLQNAKVKFQVKRSVYMPWKWTCWIPHNREVQLHAGETLTNEKGEFSIDFLAKGNENTALLSWYQYTIHAEVTDATGETHSQELTINLGSRSLMIESDLPSLMDKDFSTDVSVKAKTPNHKTIGTKMTFQVEKLRSPETIIRAPLWKTDTLLLSDQEIQENYPELKSRNSIEDFEIEALVFTKHLNTNTDSIIPKNIFKSLDVGAYKISLICLDKNGKEVKEERYMELFSSKDRQLAFPKESFFQVDKKQALAGDTVHFKIGSSHKKQAYFYHLRTQDQIIQSEWKKLKDEMDIISIPIKEEYRGGLHIQVFFERDNQLFAFNQQIAIPFDNKGLEVRLVTLRNPLEPGQKESWTLWIRDDQEQAAHAEVMATMYDASLDILQEHSWSYQPYQSTSYVQTWRSLNHHFNCFKNSYFREYVHFPRISGLQLWDGMLYGRLIYKDYTSSGGVMNPAPMIENRSANIEMVMEDSDGGNMDKEYSAIPDSSNNESMKQKTESLSPRKNLQETVFFYPQLKTDSEGYVQLKFTSPEALSSWKLMVLAHTKDMQIGHFTKEVVTQKELMVMPNLPRFLRGGDQIAISSKIINLLEEEQRVSAKLEIMDASTHEELDIIIGQQEQFLSLDAKGQKEVNWEIQVPEKVGAVIIRVLAKGPAHSDGEEHILPVLSQLHFLTDTYPFSLSSQNKLQAKELEIKAESRQEEDELTLEITTNPLWYVVQALPNYEQPQRPNALSWLNYYFMNVMASHIVKGNPEIEEVFKQWELLSPDELESELFQNPELKKVMIAETPWLLNAENQSARKKKIGRLFNENNLQYQMEMALNQLQDLQKPNGGFGWIEGMKSSVYISSQIAEALGQLIQADLLDIQKNIALKNIVNQLIEYLDEELHRIYDKAQLKNSNYYSGQALRILQSRAYFLEFYPMNHNQTAFDYFLKEWKNQKHPKSLDERMVLAKVLWFIGEKEEAIEMMMAFKDIALKDPHGAIYWRDFERYESTRKQAEMINLFELTKMETEWIDGLKLWLLQQKRANDWGDHKATAQACYAMLHGSHSLSESPDVILLMGEQEMKLDGNAGTGYFKITWKGAAIESALTTLEILKKGEGLIFGAFYDQHFEKMSQINSHDGGVHIEKQVFVAKTSGEKNELISISEETPIDLGDRILIRMLITNEQAMDFVHLRDYLPAGFENQDPLSGYRWQGSISYYQAPGDLATDYYIGHLPKGQFLIEYELHATISGKLNLGPSEIQSLYAPEFGGHSQGGMIEVMK